ncbi:glycosyl hydrolase family 28-related protein [Sphingobacterium multivorum]|uniref:glycosyl hydrolase family 28-related protein n=1 Tax=Sphingobacterium multivorum TaxID=28454 RepID=UPI003DA59288
MIRFYFYLLNFAFFAISCGYGQNSAPELGKYFISVKEFGASGDGKTDDYQAFQKAVDYCEKNSKKSLFIPYGKYLLTKPVIFRRGGLQLLGVGALLREESWLENMGKEFSNNKPFDGSTLIIPKNSSGFVFSRTVADPIRIADIQFLAKDGRQSGSTTAISFNSEFDGPTWPFVIERCHFNGFNYAIKFASKVQYNVAYLQLRQNAFKQNDECVYFADLQEPTSTGQRNLCWGFSFEDNMCHDNSRVIRAAFAKGEVNIRRNNLEGNIAYSNGKLPPFIVDLEVSNSTVNFEGNHFESIISNAVYMSSVFQDKKGEYRPHIGTTSYSTLNKVFIKGNNMDGVNKNRFKAFSLKGLLVYNYDELPLYLEECDVRVNESSFLNLFFSNDSNVNGTAIKIPARSISEFKTNGRQVLFDLIADGNNLQVRKGTASIRMSALSNFSNDAVIGTTLNVNAKDKFIGYVAEVENIEGTHFLGAGTEFFISYMLNGQSHSITKQVQGNYSYKLGKSLHIAVLRNPVPLQATNVKFSAHLMIDKSTLAERTFNLGKDYLLISFADKQPIIKFN